MNAPQIIMLLWLGLTFGLAIGDHGKPKTGDHNGWVAAISLALLFSLLWWGGFWR